MQVLLLDGNLNKSSRIDSFVKQKKYHLCEIIMSICVYYNAPIVAGGYISKTVLKRKYNQGRNQELRLFIYDLCIYIFVMSYLIID